MRKRLTSTSLKEYIEKEILSGTGLILPELHFYFNWVEFPLRICGNGAVSLGTDVRFDSEFFKMETSTLDGADHLMLILKKGYVNTEVGGIALKMRDINSIKKVWFENVETSPEYREEYIYDKTDDSGTVFTAEDDE